jgi:hypothetical protein
LRYRIVVTASVVAGCAAALLAGCGGGSKSTGGGDPNDQGMSAYLSCLSKNGVTVTVPSNRPTGTRPSSVGPGGASGGVRPSGAASGFPGGPGGGFPGGGGFQRPSGVDDATWQKAQQACASLRPSGGPAGGGSDNSAITAYRNCLTQHGVTASTAPGALNTADPTVAAAAKACAALLPTATPTPTSS